MRLRKLLKRLIEPLMNERGQFDPISAGILAGGTILSSLLSKKKTPANKAAQMQAELIQRMLGREQELYPLIQQIISGLPGEAEAMGKFELPPEALSFLEKAREEETGGLQGDIDRMIGERIAGLSRRGVTSSSTAEGSMGEVGKWATPQFADIRKRFWQNRLAMPSALAREKLSFKLDPLLNLWKTAAGTGGGMQVGYPPVQPSPLTELLKAWGSMNYPLPGGGGGGGGGSGGGSVAMSKFGGSTPSLKW